MASPFLLLKKNNGAASVLVILLMITLVAFGLLAMVYANSNYQLSQKTLEKQKAFYALDAEAEKLLSEIDVLLIKAGNEADSPDDYRSLVTEALSAWADGHRDREAEYTPADLSDPAGNRYLGYCRYRVSGAKSELDIVVSPLFYPADSGRRYEIASWQLKNSGFSYDEEIVID